MSRTAEVEHAGLLAFCEMLAFIDVYVTSGYFGHPNCHEAHETDVGIVCLNENQGASGDFGDIAL